MVFWTADFHFITMIALRGSLKGSQGFSLAGTYTHTHTHIPGSPIPLRAPRCLHGQSTSSNQLKTALSSWSMAEVGVGQDEDSGRGEQLFNFMTQWEFLFGLPYLKLLTLRSHFGCQMRHMHLSHVEFISNKKLSHCCSTLLENYCVWWNNLELIYLLKAPYCSLGQAHRFVSGIY